MKWVYGTCLQFSSVAQSCLTFCDPMDCSTPGFPVHHQLLEFPQTHVHRVGDAIQPSPPLSSPSIFPSIRVFFNESALHIRWAKKNAILPPFSLEIDLLKSHHPPLDHLLTACEKTADRAYRNLISSMFVTLLIKILKLSPLNQCNFLYQYRILSSALFYQMNLSHHLDWGFLFPQGGFQVSGGL